VTDESSETAQSSALRATSDVLLAAIDELQDIEIQKRSVAPDDPAFLELARRVDHLATVVLEQSGRQRAMAGVTTGPTGRATTPIVDVPADAPMATILEGWRAAERRLVAANPGSEAARMAEAEAAAYREAYRRAWEVRVDRTA
jgi:hypothetical protein